MAYPLCVKCLATVLCGKQLRHLTTSRSISIQNDAVFVIYPGLHQVVPGKPHFIWDDIQLSKGKLNKDRSIDVDIDGELIYCSSACNGIKKWLYYSCERKTTLQGPSFK